MDYRPRSEDSRFILNAVLDAPLRLGALATFAEADEALQAQVLEEAARFVAEAVAPSNRGGDEIGCRFSHEAGRFLQHLRLQRLVDFGKGRERAQPQGRVEHRVQDESVVFGAGPVIHRCIRTRR